MTKIIAGIKAPDSKLAKEVEQLVRDTETDLLFHHSNRVFLFGALTGQRKGSRSISNCCMSAPCFTT